MPINETKKTTPKILVIEKELYGINCGRYKVYDKDNPAKIFKHIEKAWLPEFLDSCILDPLMGVKWTSCEVKSIDEHYIVDFDLYYKRELAKSLMAKLVALDTGLSFAEGEDIVDELETHLNDVDPFIYEDLMSDYLGMTDRYSWVFIDE